MVLFANPKIRQMIQHQPGGQAGGAGTAEARSHPRFPEDVDELRFQVASG